MHHIYSPLKKSILWTIKVNKNLFSVLHIYLIPTHELFRKQVPDAHLAKTLFEPSKLDWDSENPIAHKKKAL